MHIYEVVIQLSLSILKFKFLYLIFQWFSTIHSHSSTFWKVWCYMNVSNLYCFHSSSTPSCSKVSLHSRSSRSMTHRYLVYCTPMIFAVFRHWTSQHQVIQLWCHLYKGIYNICGKSCILMAHICILDLCWRMKCKFL